MPKYKIVVEEVIKLEHLITVECEKELLESIPDPYDIAPGSDISNYAYDVLDDIDGLTVLSVEEETDYYNDDCYEITDIIPCEDEDED